MYKSSSLWIHKPLSPCQKHREPDAGPAAYLWQLKQEGSVNCGSL